MSDAAPPFRDLVERQRRRFRSGATRALEDRKRSLRRLESLVNENEARIHDALASDLRKPAFEAFASETGHVRSEVRHALSNLDSWAEPVEVGTPLTLFPSRSVIRHEPKGVVLIIAPWNYPFALVLTPLAAALAAGNCAVVKPSELARATSELLAELIPAYLPEETVAVVTGGPEASENLLKERFDHIFFTGSGAVGKIVATKAAEHLTPVTLELGGKSPAIVDRGVSLRVTAKRLAWSKFLNAGQTCIAPDYLLVPEELEEDLLERLSKTLRAFYGDDPRESPDYARIVNERHFDRILAYLDEGEVAHGGTHDRDALYVEPTLLRRLPPGARALEEEIFGPVLPLIPYRTLDDAIAIALEHPDPLALYVYSNSRENQERVLREVPFGGGAVNDGLVHFSNPELPFGGRGRSGAGSHHGRFGFETFSHRKAVVHSVTAVDPPIRYPPYGRKLRWLRKLLR